MSWDWQAIAGKEGVTWCPGCGRGNHQQGWADISNGIVHWADRKVFRKGIRHFLKLVASIKYSHNRGQPEWERLFIQNLYAFQTALLVYRFRIPRGWTRQDRIRVLYLAKHDTVPAEIRAWAAKEASS